MYNGQIAQYLGLAPGGPATEELDAQADQDPMVPAQFLAGWIYGISGRTKDYRDAMVKCFKVNDELTNDVYRGMNQYVKGHKEKGDKYWNDARKLFPQAVADCGSDITDAFFGYSKKMDEMVNKKGWWDREEEIYEDNKTEIDQNMAWSNKTW